MIARDLRLALAIALVIPTTLTSQKLTWKLPDRGVAHFKRVRSVKNLGGRGRTALRLGIEMPPLLFQGELDPRNQFIRVPPADVRDLPMWVAFDLRARRSKFRRTVTTLKGIHAIELHGVATAVDADGKQTVTVTITKPKERRRKERPAARPRRAERSLIGEIKVDRTIDRERGVVTEFRAEFRGRIVDPGAAAVARPKGKPAEPDLEGGFTVSDRWTFDRIQKNRERGFETRVAEAIRLGAEAIQRTLPKGKLANARGARDYAPGQLALKLLTLIKAGVDRRDPAVANAFDELRRYNIGNTYSLATALMAMEALYAPATEREMLIAGEIKEPFRRKVPEADFKLMARWTKKLLSCYDRTKDSAYLLRFHYTPNSRSYDNSNTQYALLGLYSAYLCGVEIPPTVWTATANHWLADQGSDGGARTTLVTTSHADYEKLRAAERAAANAGRRYATRRRTGGSTAGKGWPYKAARRRNPRAPARQPLTGSMTTAGIAGVTISGSVLRSARREKKLTKQLREARDEGLAWLHKEFSLRTNRNHHGGHYYYYMYGLERALELSQVALIGGRDWYFEGATILLELQNKPKNRARNKARNRRRRANNRGGGTFRGGGIVQTCFAVLFLKQAAPPLPVITGR